MPTLSYGLNIPSKSNSDPRKGPKGKPKPIFGEDSDEDGGKDEGPQQIDGAVGSAKASKDPKGKSAILTKPGKKVDPRFGDLQSRHVAAKQATSAQEVDPSVYSYDEVYDSIHAKPVKKTQSTGPKYMQNLLESAEIRKRDQLRAKEKMLAKEREAEGDEFADKEKFVTAAYRAQQEEVKRLEEVERKKEEEAAERRKREGGGMRGLYKDMLAREDARHEAIAKALDEGPAEEEQPDKTDEGKLAQERGAILNDEGQVVDKRQLLKAGINLNAKPKAAQDRSKAQPIAASASMNILQGKSGAKAAMRERQSRMLEDQLEQATKRAAEEEAAEQEAIQRAAKSQKTAGEISSARDRYLQRKREQEAAKAAGVEP